MLLMHNSATPMHRKLTHLIKITYTFSLNTATLLPGIYLKKIPDVNPQRHYPTLAKQKYKPK
jgi:hypothetical protein